MQIHSAVSFGYMVEEDRHKSFIIADEHIQPDDQERASRVCQSLPLNNWCVLYLNSVITNL